MRQDDPYAPAAPYGWLTDYVTGEVIRPATPDEWQRTEAVLVGGAPGAYTGAWQDDDGRAVYVDV